MEAPRHWRLREERLTGSTGTDCCQTPIVRKRLVLFTPCEYCGTRLSWTEEGWPFTQFGENYFGARSKPMEIKKEELSKKTTLVEIPKQKVESREGAVSLLQGCATV